MGSHRIVHPGSSPDAESGEDPHEQRRLTTSPDRSREIREGRGPAPGSADLQTLKLPDVGDADRTRILSNLRAQQRMYLVGRDAGTALTLLDAGFDAARTIVALDPADFAEKSGLPPQQAAVAYYAATKSSTNAAVKSIAVQQMGKSHGPAVTKTSEDAQAFLAQIPGYSTLFPDDFGFCDCKDCGSVLGLPAYFVDLMFFVEQHILDRIPANLPIASWTAATILRSCRRQGDPRGLSCLLTSNEITPGVSDLPVRPRRFARPPWNLIRPLQRASSGSSPGSGTRRSDR